MNIDESDFLPVSALQHLVFCARQCALIHIEREWEESVLTARGRLEHERVDDGYKEFRRGRRQISGLHVVSKSLGLQGQIDVLELELINENRPDNLAAFGVKGTWSIQPVEFKHGQPKESDCDRVQVCAQALCLEEMMDVPIHSASLFYQRIRRREDVALDAGLRAKTMTTVKALHELFRNGTTPPPVYGSKCKSCSLKDICMPKRMGKKNRYREILFKPQDSE